MSLIEETKEKKRKHKLGKKIREGKGSCLGVVEEKRSLLCWTLPIHHQTSKFLVFLMGVCYTAKPFNEASQFCPTYLHFWREFPTFSSPHFSPHSLFFFFQPETLKQEKASNFLYLINYVQP